MNIHLMGVGGVGMAALAVLLKSRGHDVSGCELHPGPRTAWLESLGIRVSAGHDPSHLENADALVVTPAVSPDNPELASARASGAIVRFRGDVLAEIVSGSRDSVAVCGSHGKTTTATFVAKLLALLGEDPSWAIGGETLDFPVAHSGRGPLVVEADESDGTLERYRASTLVVNRLDYDHPDHFKSEREYFACFDKARANAGSVIESESLSAIPELESLAAFAALAAHNRTNARAAVEVALRRGHALERVLAALPEAVAALPDRRFQTLSPGVVTDYAHHPVEMRCAVAMARAKCTGVLRVLFQPHRYSRTRALLETFPAAFEGADEVILCPTYAAFEKPVAGGDVADLYDACRRAFAAWPSPPRLYLAPTCEAAAKHASLEARSGDMTLVLGAGDIVRIATGGLCAPAGANAAAPRDLSAFSFFRVGGVTYGGGARRVVGAGSNLWISDLATDAEYVRLAGGCEGGSCAIISRSRPAVVGAGTPGSSLGIPWMVGIPGTVGGWAVTNAGAFGHAIGDLIARVLAGGRWIGRDECGFGYRTSAIAGTVEAVEFDFSRLSVEPGVDYASRRHRFPPRCCGSVFKNPPGDFAGRLLELAGAKGMKVGGACVWEGHANVIVCRDGANASDVLALAQLLAARVRDRFGVALQAEIRDLAV